MNKYILYGGLSIAGLVGFMYFKNASTPADVAATDTSQTPLLYATGLGTQAVPSSATQGPTTDLNSVLSNLSSVLSGNSQNDLTASLAQIGASRDVALASISSDTTVAKINANSDFMTKFMANISGLAKAGISQIMGAGGIGAGIVYSDPTKNLSYATGVDASGNIVGKGTGGADMLLQLSAQTQYNSSKYVDATGKTLLGKITTLGGPYMDFLTKLKGGDHGALVALPVNVAPGLSDGYSQGAKTDHGISGTKTGNDTVSK